MVAPNLPYLNSPLQFMHISFGEKLFSSILFRTGIKTCCPVLEGWPRFISTLQCIIRCICNILVGGSQEWREFLVGLLFSFVVLTLIVLGSPVPSPEKPSPNKSPPHSMIKPSGFNPNAPSFVPMALQHTNPNVSQE